jgi:hypothetical protein
VYTTVDYAFAELAKLKKGERVLIHAATGGVGLVAVQYAQRLGAKVFATAGKEEKHAHLRGLGVMYIASSRDGAAFEQDMKKFLEEDGGDGFDVVLNSLSHDDYIPRSLAMLRKGGRFCEIGKRGVWTKEEMQQAHPGVQYHLIAIDHVMQEDPDHYQILLARLQAKMAKQLWEPLPMVKFTGFAEGVEALRCLQRAAHIGKVVLEVPSRMNLDPTGTYVLSGGRGALGLTTAKALVEEGAKKVLLLSRSGKPAPDAGDAWAWLEASSAKIESKKCDIGDAAAVKKVLTGVAVKGAFHLAAVLDDAMLAQLTQGGAASRR